MDSTPKLTLGNKIGIGIVAIIILFFIFCFRVVGVGQVGLVTTFGKVTGESQSGIIVKAPWPIQHLTKMNIKTLKEQQDASAATKDLQTVTATVAINYNLTPKTAKTVFTDVGTNYTDVILAPTLQNSVKAVTAEYNAADLIQNRADVERKLNDLMVSKLADHGITVTSTNIVNFSFSAEFNTAIEQKQVAQQQAQKAQYDLQTSTTQAQANQVQQAALTPEILEQQAIAKWNGVLPTTVSGSDTVFNIPLK